jgi:excisionase family DNA binding protein
MVHNGVIGPPADRAVVSSTSFYPYRRAPSATLSDFHLLLREDTRSHRQAKRRDDVLRESSGRDSSADEAASSPLLITAEEVARMMNVSTRTLWRLLSAGRFPKPVRFGGNTRWRVAEVLRWIEDGCPQQSPTGRGA